jgi:hypothetical protein
MALSLRALHAKQAGQKPKKSKLVWYEIWVDQDRMVTGIEYLPDDPQPSYLIAHAMTAEVDALYVSATLPGSTGVCVVERSE